MMTAVKALAARERAHVPDKPSARHTVGIVALAEFILLICVLFPTGAWAVLYRWTDEQGQVHVTDNPNDIPPRYRSKPPPGAAPPAAPPPSPSPSTAPSTRPALDPEVEARDRDLREQGNQPRNYIDPRGQIFRATPTRGRYFEQWRDALQSPSAAVRSNAALTLGYFGSQATPVLIQTLKDPSADVRLSAVASLNAIGPGARPAGPALAPLLRDPEQNVRLAASVALLGIGAHVKDALLQQATDMRQLKGELWDTTTAMLISQVAAPAAVPALAALLRDPDPRTRELAMHELGRVRPPSTEAITTLTQALKDPDLTMRAMAGPSLGLLWRGALTNEGFWVGALKPSPEAIAALIQALKDPVHEVQKGAVKGLSNMGAGAASAAPELFEVFKNSPGPRRQEALEALNRVAPDGTELMSALRLGLTDTDPEVQLRAARTVPLVDMEMPRGPLHDNPRFQKRLAELVPVLLEAAKSPDAKVRREMLHVLGMTWRQPSAEVITTLTQALRDPAPEVQVTAASSLSLMKTAAVPAVPALVEAFNSPSPALRGRVLMTLVDIAPDSRLVMSTLLLALRDPGVQLQAAGLAPRVQGPAAKELIPALLEGARSPDARVRSEMLRAMGQVALPASREVADALTQGLRDPEVSVRLSSASSLATAGPEATVALPLLIQALGDPDWRMRRAAINALGGMGPLAKDALGPLKELERRDRGQQREIAESIRRIESR